MVLKSDFPENAGVLKIPKLALQIVAMKLQNRFEVDIITKWGYQFHGRTGLTIIRIPLLLIIILYTASRRTINIIFDYIINSSRVRFDSDMSHVNGKIYYKTLLAHVLWKCMIIVPTLIISLYYYVREKKKSYKTLFFFHYNILIITYYYSVSVCTQYYDTAAIQYYLFIKIIVVDDSDSSTYADTERNRNVFMINDNKSHRYNR